MAYYTRINRVVSGPISEEDLIAQIRAKSITMLDEVSADGVNWRRLGTLPIYGAAMSAPAAGAPSAASPAQRCSAVPGAEPDVRASGTYHLYCDKCGHEWYSNRWDTYCPKGGCTGRARKYAVPQQDGEAAQPRQAMPPSAMGRISSSNRRPVLVALAVAAVAAVVVVAALCARTSGGKAATIRQEIRSASNQQETVTKPTSAPAGATAFLSPGEGDIVALFNKVRHSAAVANNLKYSEVAAGIDCHVVDDDTLNAYAHWKRLDSGALIREICYHSGHARFDRVVGAIASKTDGDDGDGQGNAQAVATLVLGIPKALRENGHRIDAGTAAALLAVAGVSKDDFANPEFVENARKIADGIALSTFSHEMGHHVLGHLDGNPATASNPVFSKAQEEQADSFATLVMSTAATQEDRHQIFMGRFLWCFIVACSEHSGSDEDRSHPATRRRLRALIEGDQATARELGISLEDVDKLLDAVSSMLNGGNEPAASATGASPAAGESGVYHLYCDRCGHTWYSSRWDNYCPKWGCNGSAKRM